MLICRYFYFSDHVIQTRYLKKIAVPSCNLSNIDEMNELNNQRLTKKGLKASGTIGTESEPSITQLGNYRYLIGKYKVIGTHNYSLSIHIDLFALG